MIGDSRRWATGALLILALSAGAQQPRTALPMSTNPNDFSWLLTTYLEAYETYRNSNTSADADLALGAATELAKRYLALPEIQYVSAVRQLQILSTSHPEAIAELALSLELGWEKRYLPAYYRAEAIHFEKQRLAAELANAVATVLIAGRVATVSTGVLGTATSGWVAPRNHVAALYASGQTARLAAAVTPTPHVRPAPSALLRMAPPVRMEPEHEIQQLLLEKKIAVSTAASAVALLGWSEAWKRIPHPTTVWEKILLRFGFPLFVSTSGYIATEISADFFLSRATEAVLERAVAASADRLDRTHTANAQVAAAGDLVRDTLRLAAYRDPDFLRMQIAAVSGQNLGDLTEFSRKICANLKLRDPEEQPTPVSVEERAEALRRGEISRSIDGLLLQSAAILREQGSGILNAYAEQALEVRAARFESVLALCEQFEEEDK